MNWNQHSYQLYFSETLYYINEFFGFFVLFFFKSKNYPQKEKDWFHGGTTEANLSWISSTQYFWQQWNWILRIITLWMSWGRWETSQGLPVLSCKLYKTALQQDSCDLCSHTANTPKISEWESNKRVVGRGHWCTPFLPFAFHNKSNSASCLPSMHHCTLTISFLLFITKKFLAAQTALVNKRLGIAYFQVWAYFRI